MMRRLINVLAGTALLLTIYGAGIALALLASGCASVPARIDVRAAAREIGCGLGGEETAPTTADATLDSLLHEVSQGLGEGLTGQGCGR